MGRACLDTAVRTAVILPLTCGSLASPPKRSFFEAGAHDPYCSSFDAGAQKPYWTCSGGGCSTPNDVDALAVVEESAPRSTPFPDSASSLSSHQSEEHDKVELPRRVAGEEDGCTLWGQCGGRGVPNRPTHAEPGTCSARHWSSRRAGVGLIFRRPSSGWNADIKPAQRIPS